MLKHLSRIMKRGKIHEINERFRSGGMVLGPGARALLFVLKIYLVAMVALLVIKFVQIYRGGVL